LRGANAISHVNELDRFTAAYEIFSEQEILQLISVRDTATGKYPAYFYELLQLNTDRNAVERMMAIDTRLNLADDLLNYTDKITMHHSIECRVPMLDLELVKYIESLPQFM